jgi:hypothetical protein
MLDWCRVGGEQVGDVRLGVVVEARDEGVDVGVGCHLRGIDEQLAPPNKTGFLTEVDNLLEEALEDVDAEALPDAGQAGVVGQRFVQGVTQVPPVGEVETRRLDQLPFRSPRRT